MLSRLNVSRWMIWLPLVLSLAACSSPPPLPSPPAVVQAPIRPPLPDELKTPPKPTGGYWSSVIEWRKTWAEALKALQPRSEP